MKPKQTVLIIAKQDQIRDGLQVLLTSLSISVELASVVSTDSLESVSAPPEVILLVLDGTDTDAETGKTLEHIKSAWPRARTAVLVENESQYNAVVPAGVDTVLFNGMLAAEVLKKIERLLLSTDEQDPRLA